MIGVLLALVALAQDADPPERLEALDEALEALDEALEARAAALEALAEALQDEEAPEVLDPPPPPADSVGDVPVDALDETPADADD